MDKTIYINPDYITFIEPFGDDGHKVKIHLTTKEHIILDAETAQKLRTTMWVHGKLMIQVTESGDW